MALGSPLCTELIWLGHAPADRGFLTVGAPSLEETLHVHTADVNCMHPAFAS